MITQFSVALKGGIEVYRYPKDPENSEMNDPQLLSGFMEAMQLFSESFGKPIERVRFSNKLLYVKTYGDFSLRLFVDDEIPSNALQNIFKTISKAVFSIFSKHKGISSPKPEIFDNLLIPLIQKFNSSEYLQEKTEIQPIKHETEKVAIVGMNNAGKTSIKNIFFKRWSKEMVKYLAPTIGVVFTKEFQEFITKNLLIMDFGGQEAYRKQYLEQQELWRDLSALIYVIDVQDTEKYQDAVEYLRSIWALVTKLNFTPPKIAIFFHKYDVSKRKKLNKLLVELLPQLQDFNEIATFHLTTIEDSSSLIAMIKVLYFSLPNALLKRMLEEQFLDHFEKQIIPKFQVLIKEKGFGKSLEKAKPQLRLEAVKLGVLYGLSIQKTWLQYLNGEWSPNQRLLSSKNIELEHKGNSLLVTIPHYDSDHFTMDISKNILDGILEGLLKTFFLPPPEISHNSSSHTTWKIEIR